MTVKPRAKIQLSALSHNFDVIRQTLSRSSKIVAMVKANAYGHGLKQVARTLKNSDAFGVSIVDEGMVLIRSGISQQIIVMKGFLTEACLIACAEHGLTPVIHHAFQLELLANTVLSKPLDIWIKVDTGMNRLGFSADELPGILEKISRCPNTISSIALMSHLADADAADQRFTQRQLVNFCEMASNYAFPLSLCNSAGILAYPDSVYDYVRPGILLYGVSPFHNRTGRDEGLLPVMTLLSRVIAIKTLHAGDQLGYGAAFTAKKTMRVAVVGIGYGDGYPRHAAFGTPVLIKGRRCSIIGRVSMDMLSVDVTHLSNVSPGDDVILWGDGLPIEEVAQHSTTLAYELFCQLTARVEYCYVD